VTTGASLTFSTRRQNFLNWTSSLFRIMLLARWSNQADQILLSADQFAWYWGPFLDGPEKFLHPESCSKISNLMITELFYLVIHILNMARSVLHTRSFRRIHLSVFRYRLTENDFAGLKSFWSFQETGPWVLTGLLMKSLCAFALKSGCHSGLKEKSTLIMILL